MTQAVQDVTGPLLKRVSRSFYLTIRFLPKEMRPAIALAYMLARATDTVADTAQTSEDERLRLLLGMREAIAGRLSDEQRHELYSCMRRDLLPVLSLSSEKELISEWENCLRLLVQTTPAVRELIQHVLDTIIEGQMWDLTAFRDAPRVTSDEETRRYTYAVAGCVGEFWTHLGFLVLGERFCESSRRSVMSDAGVRYGQGLQLVNIIRDMEEDAARGRYYLCSDAHKWLNRAEYYLKDGVDYSSRLGMFRLRFASMLPALLGLETIELLRRSELGRGKVKISRRTVYFTMLKAVLKCLFRRNR